MASAQERLKLKRPCEVWSVKEQLCLASSVLKSGDQNWMSVSRSLKPFLEKELQRPVDWFSQKACALQYAQLLENADTPKRKKRETSETIGESIVRRLTQERIAELSQFLATQREEYQQLKNELNLLKSGNIAEDKLQKMWLNIELEEREQEQKNKTHSTWLARRQKQEGQTPQILGFNIQRKSESSESGHDTLDPNTDEEEKKNKGGRSPLLTSLLKSPSPTTQIQSQTSSAQVTSPTIASLLGSSPKIPNPPLTQTVSSQLHQLVSTAIVNATPERPSAGAPTLSMLLELPANLQRATLSNLQTHTPTATTTTITNLPQQNVDLQLMQIDNQRSNIQIIEPPITPANMSTSEMIDHIDEVIPKDIMADVIDKDEINEIIGDIEELIKGEIPDNPQVLDSGATNIIGNINQPIITGREEIKNTQETVSIADSSSTSEMPLVEINSNTSNIAEIIGTVTAENKEKKAENENKSSPKEEEPKDKKSLESKELPETRKSTETTDKTKSINEEQTMEIENKNNSVEKGIEKQESKKTSEAVKETNKSPNEETKSSKEEEEEEEATAKSSKEINKKTVKEETKKSTKEEEEGKKNPKEETKKITKEETKVAKEETKRISKEEIKKTPKEEAKKILKDDPKKNPKEEIKKPSKDEIKKPPREEIKKNPIEEVKKPSKDDSKKPTNTDESKKVPKDEKTPKDEKISKEDAKKTQKEEPAKKNSKDETKKSTKEETVKKNPKEEAKKNVKDETKNPKEEQKRTTKEETVKKITKEEPAKKNPKDEVTKKNPKEEQKKNPKEETKKNPKEEATKKNSKEETKKNLKEEATKKSNKVEIKKPIADETKKSTDGKKSEETKNIEDTKKLTENSKQDPKEVKTTNEVKETRENKSTEKCGNPEEIIQNSENHSNKNNDQQKIEANTTKQDQNATTEILSVSSNDTLINEDTEKSQDISLILEEEDTPANQEKKKDDEKILSKDIKQEKSDNDVEEHQNIPDNVKLENFKKEDTKDSSDGTSNTELLEADMKDFDDDDDEEDDEQTKIDDKEKISKFIPIEIKKEDDIGIREENEIPDEMRSETIKCTKEVKDEIDEKKIHLDDSAISRKEQSQFSGSVSELDEEESSLSKLSGGRAMKTYSKRQTIAIDSEPEMESSEGADYRAWKKAVMLVYNRLATHKYASAFLRPITEDQAPGYHSIIFRPMDLSTIKKNIDNGTIRSTRHFQRDVMLMFQNAIMYNKHDTFVYKMAITMQEECLQHMQILVQVTGEVSFRRETRTAASTSNESSETISKRKRSHITPSPHDTDNSRGKKRRKSEND
ncbi:bromodomain-containing protein 8-like [Leptopilina heterotoma]|uniref:bromodomain-containing protein 8-like n=1 Tax=Leptopilina heterotoma TaxID=63436 RepID=UPI001CA99064|nr:bromodomain-containing protein 8-like [Leptopilina heterotoma]